MEETTKKTIIFESKLVERIEKLAKESERDFSGQVRYMLKEYLRIKEND